MSASLERHLRFLLDEQKVAATLRIGPGANPEDLTAEAISAFLDSKAIARQCVDKHAVAALAQQAAADTQAEHDAVVARGTEPVHGKDGRFEFVPHINLLKEQIDRRAKAASNRRLNANGEFETIGNDAHDADEQSIDFYNLSAYVVIEANEPIGRIEPPTAGTDGMDVFGNAIPAVRGNSTDVHAGPGTKDDGNGLIVSACAGKLVHEPNEVRVESTLDIPGYVDFSTGNVSFPGDVVVRKGVRDRFEVRAGGDLVISDLVEAASISCGSNIKLDGGMSGRGAGKIDISGTARARYLDGVSGRVEGDLLVDKEISTCNLVVGRRIESPNCTIRGGEIRVAKRLEVAQIGGEGEIRTEIIMGHSPALRQVTDVIGPISDEIITTHKEAKAALDELNASDHRGAIHQERLTEATFALANARRLASEIRERLERVNQLTDSGPVTLVARRAIHPGSTIWFAGWKAEPSEVIKGPVVIDLSPEGEPRYAPLGSEEDPKPLSCLCTVVKDDRVPRISVIYERLTQVA